MEKRVNVRVEHINHSRSREECKFSTKGLHSSRLHTIHHRCLEILDGNNDCVC
jgi:hypothetical protein